jgi:hypothetical protein
MDPGQARRARRGGGAQARVPPADAAADGARVGVEEPQGVRLEDEEAPPVLLRPPAGPGDDGREGIWQSRAALHSDQRWGSKARAFAAAARAAREVSPPPPLPP